MTTSSVQIKGGPVGLDEVVINGQDVSSQLTAVTVVAESPQSVNQVHLTAIADVNLDIEGAVYVHDGVSAKKIAGAVVEWLNTRNAREIEAEALGRFGMNDDEPFAAKVLGVLADMASEAGELAS